MASIALPEAKPLPSGPAAKRSWSPWQKWGLILLAPYIVVFIVLAVYPVGYGLWLARHPAHAALTLEVDHGLLESRDRRLELCKGKR